MRNAIDKIGLVALIGALGGCIAEPYQRPAVAVPAAWLGQAAPAPTAWPDPAWWKAFRSEELDRLVAEAQANNHDLKAAAARVAQARANVRVVGSTLYPALFLAASATREKPAGGTSGNQFSVGPIASYEVDVWGRNRQGAESADATLLATRYAEEATRVSLAADVTTTYFLILSLNDRLRVAQENLDNARRLMELIEVQKRAGKVSALELERQRTQAASAEAAIPALLQQRQVVRDALAVLLGRNPGEQVSSEPSLRSYSLPTVPAGLPSALLERRPDIRQAEAALIAAHADVNAARAALFPRLALTGSAGFTAATVSRLGDAGTGFSLIVAELVATIFDGGRLAGLSDLAQARKEELIQNYHRSVVFAFRDVEDALAGIEQFARQEAAQQEAVAHAREAYRLAELRYREGGTDYTTVLDAQRTLISAEAAVDPVRFARFTSVVGLHRALGGGWEAPLVVSGER